MKNDIIFGKCVDLTVEGHGIAKCDGLVVFVKGMIPEEEGNIKIISEKKNYAFGIIDKLTKESTHRVKSDCPISYKCGGCDLRYIDYDYQLVLKKKLLENTLEGFKVCEIVKDDNPTYYRNKVQIPVKEDKMGFYRKFSNDVVEFDDCLIESKLANRIIDDLKFLLNEHKLTKYFRHILIKHAQGTDEVMIGFIVNTFEIELKDIVDYLVNKYSNIKSIILNLNNRDTNVILGDQEKLLYGQDYIFDVYDGIKVKIALKSFYQVNYKQMLKLYTLVKELSSVSKNDNVLDLYSGIGTISLYLARYAKHVTGVEIVDAAVKNAIDNAKLNGFNNVDFILADASKKMDDYIKDKDIVVVDPPRKGISKELINSFVSNKTKKIVYVSCNPATLARDLNILKEYYTIGEIHPVDMFGHTIHTECVTCLTLND